MPQMKLSTEDAANRAAKPKKFWCPIETFLKRRPKSPPTVCPDVGFVGALSGKKIVLIGALLDGTARCRDRCKLAVNRSGRTISKIIQTKDLGRSRIRECDASTYVGRVDIGKFFQLHAFGLPR
jgi:hypothetical protein